MRSPESRLPSHFLSSLAGSGSLQGYIEDDVHDNLARHCDVITVHGCAQPPLRIAHRPCAQTAAGESKLHVPRLVAAVVSLARLLACVTACSCIVCSLHTGFAQIVPNLGLALNTQWCVLASVWPLPCLSSCLQCWLQAFGVQAVHVVAEPSESGLCANQQRRLRADVRLLQQAGGVLGVPCDLLPRHPCGQPVCSRPCLSMSMAVAVAVGVLSARVAACSCSTPACRPPSSARSPARCLSRHATPRPPRHLSATQPTNQPTHCVLPIHPSHRRRRPFAVLVFADRARNLISHRRLHHRVRGLQARVHHAAADPNPLSRYDSYATFAAIMVIVYPIGIPAFIFGATLRRLPVAALICTCVALPACLQPCSIGTACVWTSQACAPSWASSTMATTARCGCASFSTRRFSSTACAWWRIIHADHDLAQAQDGDADRDQQPHVDVASLGRASCSASPTSHTCATAVQFAADSKLQVLQCSLALLEHDSTPWPDFARSIMDTAPTTSSCARTALANATHHRRPPRQSLPSDRNEQPR